MISDENLLKLLDDWNLWKRDIAAGIDREQYIKRLMPLIERKEILVIKGIRRSGKSTIMKQLMKRLIRSGVGKTQLLYINLEDYNLKDSLEIGLLENCISVFKAHVNKDKRTYFFIDEIQLIPEWERFLRTKYDIGGDVKFIVSGSNASLLSKELSTLLTGRNITIEVKPLNYIEFKFFRKNGDLDEFLKFGGFPEVVLEEDVTTKKMLLQQYFEDIINKDIIARHKIRNTETVFNLARYLIENSGGKQSMNRLAKTLGVDDKTVNEYISYMLDAFIIFCVPFFSFSLKRRFSKANQSKYYSADNGFFQITSLHFSEDRGKRFENAVALTILHAAKDVAYWSGKGEVDFVYGNNAVNATVAKSIPGREFEGLVEFKEKNRHHETLIVVLHGEPAENMNIRSINFEEFCREILNPA